MDAMDVGQGPIPGRLFEDLAAWRRSSDPSLMRTLRQSYCYQPEANLDCAQAPVVATLESGIGTRGYSVHVHMLQTKGSRGAVLRLITATEGIGLDVCVQDRDMLAVRVIPEESDWTPLTALPPFWSSVTCVHVNIPKPVLHVYVNGAHAASVPVPYPAAERWSGQTLMVMLGGGYTGRLALCAVFGDPLPHRAVTFLHAIPVNYPPHFNEQNAFSVMGFPITVTALYPSGVPAFPELPRIDYAPGQMALFPRTLIWLTASVFTEAGVCDPLPFPNRSIDVLQGVRLEKACNLQASFESGGGLRLFLVSISPSFLGRRFVSAQEAADVVELLAGLIRGCVSFAYDLGVLGAIAIHNLIYSWVEIPYRTLDLLLATRSLLTAVDLVDITGAKHLFLDVFTATVLDMAFWSEADADCQRALVDLIVPLVMPNPTVFAHAIGVDGFMYQFQALRAKGNDILADCCLRCIGLIATSADLPVLLRIVVAVRNDAALHGQFLRILSKLAFDDSAAFRDLILSDTAFNFRALLQIASATDDVASRIGLRMVGVVLVMTPSSSRATLARSASLFIEENLRLNADVYASLAQLLVGEITVSPTDGAVSAELAFHDEQVLQIPEMLPALFSLMRASGDDALVDRILMDILSIIKISDRNKMAFTRSPFWQRWLLPYCPDDQSQTSTTTVRAQIALQIVSIGLLYCLCQEDKGWVAVDQTLWLIGAHAASASGPRADDDTRAFRLKCAICLEVVTMLSRSSSQEFGPDTSPMLALNLKPTLQLVERILFEAGPSPVGHPDRDLDAATLTLLERLLIAALKFLPFPERREHIVRLVLRYIQAVLPRPESQTVCPVILGAASQVFGLMLGDKTAVNLRLVQMAVAFLQVGARTLHPLGAIDAALDVERVVQSLVHVWGTAVFTDLNQLPVNETDSDRATLLGRRDSGEAAAAADAAEINNSLPVMLTEAQIQQVALDTFDRLRSKFASIVRNRTDKLDRMLHEYSNKVAEALAAKRLSDVKTQNEFQQLLQGVTMPFTGSAAPATVQAIVQRNTYLMGRAVLVLKQFRDAFEFSAVRDHRDTFWRVDPTENSMRMRYLLKRNPNGDNHPGAAARSSALDALPLPSTASLPAVLAAAAVGDRSAVDDDAAVSETDEKSSTEWQNEAVGADDDDNSDPVGFKIDRPGEAVDDAVPVPSAQPLMVVACTLISLTRKIDGEFTVFADSLRFVGRQEHRSPGEMPVAAAAADTQPPAAGTDSTAPVPMPGAGDDPLLPFKPRTHFWLLRDIRQVLPRRYLLRECGMEIFTKTYRSYFFTFERAQRTPVYKRVCALLRLPAELSNMRRLRYSGITEKWVNRQISNYEYLAHLNTIAGRTYNDITQYPVFPSIIQDFTSSELDLTDPHTFRDLSKPIGALNPERLRAFEAKYQDMVEIGDPAMPPFHYGSHYLSAGIVLYYLVRLEPFTSLGIQLQGGRFDLPDRLFTSIKGAWDLSISNLSDVKELIPEFFYLPEFLRNLNQLPLGQRQDGSEVGDVLLPPWASSAEQFVALHRAALESDYVSDHLPDWIDLIFGYKQQGPEAVAARNVFFHLTYAGAVDLDLIKDEALRQATVAQIYHFGQTPSQLFDKPHPHQKPLEVCTGTVLGRARFPSPDALRTGPHLNWAADTLARNSALSDVVMTRTDLLAHCYVDHLGDLRFRSRMLSAMASRSDTPVPIRIGRWSGTAALSRTGQLLLSGGLAKGALECYLCPTGRLIARAYAGHHSPITCLQIDPDQAFVVSGARNGTVCLWSVFLKRHAWSRPPILSNATWTFALQGVDGPVTRVAICAGLGLAAAAFGNGTCALFSVRRKSLVRAFYLPDRQPIDLLHLTTSARLVITSQATIYLYTCNARLLRVLDWGQVVTVIASNRSGEYVMVGGQRSRRLTVHSFCEMDKVDEIDYGPDRALAADPDDRAAPYPVVAVINQKENLMAIAFSDQSMFVTQIATTRDGDAASGGLLAASADLARDIAADTLDVLRESLESPLKQVNDQIAGALDRAGTAEAASGSGTGGRSGSSSNLWNSLSKVKGKLFGAGPGSSSTSKPT